MHSWELLACMPGMGRIAYLHVVVTLTGTLPPCARQAMEAAGLPSMEEMKEVKKKIKKEEEEKEEAKQKIKELEQKLKELGHKLKEEGRSEAE